MKIFKLLYRLFSSLLIDPFQLKNKFKGLPYYIRDYFYYKKLQSKNPFKANFNNLYPILYDRFESAGNSTGAYFLQDLWAADYLYKKNTKEHIDIGSRIDGFIAHILPFSKVEYVDIRKLTSAIDNLVFKQGSITNLPYESSSIESLSCLHVLEHIGLGRYGDQIDPMGYIKGAHELSRVLAKSGILLFSTPVGKQKLYFNAHRVFDPNTIINLFGNLKLLEFHLIDDKAQNIKYNADFTDATNCNYGCGLFVFTKE